MTYLRQASHRVSKKELLSVVNGYLEVQTGYQVAAYKKLANHNKFFQLNC